jgi:hypothetical protein
MMSENQQVSLGPVDLSSVDLEAFIRCQAPAEGNAASDPCGEKKLALEKWLFERRLDYARYFFDHHAKQRMSMFNFFLIFSGFVISGYANLSKDGNYLFSTTLALAGAVLTIFFICLDRRNEELVHIAEDVLGALESDALFTGYDRFISWPKRHKHWYALEVEGSPTYRPLGIFRRQIADESGLVETVSIQQTSEGKEIVNKDCTEWKKSEPQKCDKSKYEHGKWLPGFQFCILGMFVILAILPWIHEYRCFLVQQLSKLI